MCAGEINQEYEMRWTMEHIYYGFEVCQFCHVLNVIELTVVATNLVWCNT